MLKNKNILITGGCGLIGSGIAREIIKNSGNVIILDTQDSLGKSLVNELGQERIKFFNIDVCNEESLERLIHSFQKEGLTIDAAIHAAYPRSKQWGKKFEDLKLDLLGEDLTMQLGGAILFSKIMVAFFRRQGFGNIVHVSSIQGLFSPKFEHYEGTTMVSPIEYSAIKSGVVSITKYLAKYCKGENIRINAICPGGILDKQPSSFLEKYKNSCSQKGMLDPKDINGALVFLLSDNSKYITGQAIVIDDGWSL